MDRQTEKGIKEAGQEAVRDGITEEEQKQQSQV